MSPAAASPPARRAPPARRSPARREAMRALQLRLIERLRTVSEEPQQTAWIAVEAGAAGYLLPLAQTGEIFHDAPLMPLPHTQPWFQGVASLRGQLHGVVDLAAFLEGSRRSSRLAGVPQRATRLVSMNPGLGTWCALRVDRLVGLRQGSQLREAALPPGVPPSFVRRGWQDESARCWVEIDLVALAGNDAFLGIAS